MLAHSSAAQINPSTQSQPFCVFATLSYPVFLHTVAQNKFEAMAQLQTAPDSELLIHDINGKKLDVELVDDAEIQDIGVMAEDSEEILIHYTEDGLYDPTLEEDEKQGLLVPMDNDNKKSEPKPENTIDQSIISKLQGFEKALRIMGLSLKYNR